MPKQSLAVWVSEQHVGDLSVDPALNLFAFTYRQEWISNPNGFSLSDALPRITKTQVTPEVHSAAVRSFFENLLPEGRALEDAAAVHKISKSNTFGLLATLGREMPGAIRILPGESQAEQEAAAMEPALREITHAELSERLRGRPELPFSIWDRKIRLSIPGYQDKLAVFMEGGKIFLVNGGPYASTHILKPEATERTLAGITSNEFFCMRLAKRARLAVADVELLHVPEPVLSVLRFDRMRATSSVSRIHVIDGCQALGLPPSLKYERPYGNAQEVRSIRDGASLPALFALLDKSANPLIQKRELLRWVIFQALIGNADAHAKNLSFFSGPHGLSLAPAYDVVSSVSLNNGMLDNSFAMAIGDAFTHDELGAYAWADFAHGCGLAPAFVGAEIKAMCASIRRSIDEVLRDAVAHGADAAHLAQARDVILGLVAVQERQAAMVKSVNRPALDPETSPIKIRRERPG